MIKELVLTPWFDDRLKQGIIIIIMASLLGLKLKQDHIHYHARQSTIDQQEWIRDQAFDKKSKEEEELN